MQGNDHSPKRKEIKISPQHYLVSNHYQLLDYNVEVLNSSMSLDVLIFASFIFHIIDNGQIRYKNVLVQALYEI